MLEKISKKDYLINAPYQSFSYLIKFLREAALDPKVTTIKITLYRLAKNSQIISSLINAAKNGKKVTVQIELQARFDEASNIYYAEQMQTEGINLIFGIKGLKVHSKICVIERIQDGKLKRYGLVSTGNFNETTAKVYTDVTLFTSHDQILKDINKVFDFFDVNFRVYRYKHLIVSPHYTRSRFYKLIDREILHAKIGSEAYIKLKMNSLSDFDMIDKLYEASPRRCQNTVAGAWHLFVNSRSQRHERKHRSHQHRRQLSRTCACVYFCQQRRTGRLYFVGRFHDAKPRWPR